MVTVGRHFCNGSIGVIIVNTRRLCDGNGYLTSAPHPSPSYSDVEEPFAENRRPEDRQKRLQDPGCYGTSQDMWFRWRPYVPTVVGMAKRWTGGKYLPILVDESIRLRGACCNIRLGKLNLYLFFSGCAYADVPVRPGRSHHGCERAEALCCPRSERGV